MARLWFYCSREGDEDVNLFPNAVLPEFTPWTSSFDGQRYVYPAAGSNATEVCLAGFRKVFGFTPRKGIIYKVSISDIEVEKVGFIEDQIVEED